jgi:drug/metabolite transporter (DMT)-like permease
MKKYLGIALLVVGVALLVLAYQEYNSAGSKFGRALKSDPSQKLLIYGIGGSLCAGLGAFRIIKK